MQILTEREAVNALKRLDGPVLYLAWKCGLYKALNARAVVVLRQGVGLEELISSIKYGLSFAPRTCRVEVHRCRRRRLGRNNASRSPGA